MSGKTKDYSRGANRSPGHGYPRGEQAPKDRHGLPGGKRGREELRRLRAARRARMAPVKQSAKSMTSEEIQAAIGPRLR